MVEGEGRGERGREKQFGEAWEGSDLLGSAEALAGGVL